MNIWFFLFYWAFIVGVVTLPVAAGWLVGCWVGDILKVRAAHAKPKPVEAECPCGGDGVIVCGKSMEGDYLEKPCPIHSKQDAGGKP